MMPVTAMQLLVSTDNHSHLLNAGQNLDQVARVEAQEAPTTAHTVQDVGETAMMRVPVLQLLASMDKHSRPPDASHSKEQIRVHGVGVTATKPIAATPQAMPTVVL